MEGKEKTAVEPGTTEVPEAGSQGAGGEPPAGAPTGGFTQEQVDEMVRKRLEQQARNKFADYDELKKAADELKKLRQAQMSEQEKAVARVTELEQRLADSEMSATELRMTIAERLIRAEVASVARDLEFADPDDAWRLADLAEVKADEELNVDRAAVKKSLDRLAKEKPYLLKRAAPPPGGTPPRGTRGSVEGKPAPVSMPVIRY